MTRKAKRAPKPIDIDDVTAELRRDVRGTRPEWSWLADWQDGRSAESLAARAGIPMEELRLRLQAALRASRSPLRSYDSRPAAAARPTITETP